MSRAMTLLRKENGQALLEFAVVAPALIAFFILLLSSLMAAGAVFLLEDRIEETLVCLSYRPRSFCEGDLRAFLKSSGLGKLEARSRFLKNGAVWRGILEFSIPGGSRVRLERSLELPLRGTRS